MFEFEVIQDLNLNDKILGVIKSYDYTVKNGKIKHLKSRNLQFIELTEYLITYPITLTIFEYKVNEIADKSFYIKEYNQKYSLKEINIEYRTTTINFANYSYIVFVSAKIIKMDLL